MPNGPKGGLDRRDFMILALGSVGATAAVSVNADAAMAQDATVSSGAPGTGLHQGTVYTGDVIQGKKVISALDVMSDAKLFANRSALFANDAESAMIACSLL
jgi:uncharacterized protein